MSKGLETKFVVFRILDVVLALSMFTAIICWADEPGSYSQAVTSSKTSPVIHAYNTTIDSQPVTIENASRETLSTAIGHYSRARSLLVSAIREFDLGYKLVDPSSIIDAEQWRKILVTRARDLER